MIALRGRYHPSQWRKLPKLFPNGFSNGPNQDALRDRAGAVVRALAFSAAGVLIGQSVGFGLGTWKSSQIIKREGNYENIERVMKKVQKDVIETYGKEGMINGGAGATRPLPSQGRRVQSQHGSQDASNDADFNSFYGDKVADAGENSRLARNFEKDSTSTTTFADTPFTNNSGHERHLEYESPYPSRTSTSEIDASGSPRNIAILKACIVSS